ncbi:MAG: type II toxin-antitoxin system BrnA family antitoxin [Nitrospinota bacterium]
MKKKKSTKIVKTTSRNLEERFSKGESVIDYFDTGKTVRRINLDMPVWALKGLDAESTRRGITRQSLIKTWIIDRLDALREKRSG